ncbi:hypothetical protein GQ42DRAFT_159842 [Ramicandelaber brevisporus]|nr:hypothetical protein GQ42DRAFT_159842 [Ramicandelaber brevisporus]
MNDNSDYNERSSLLPEQLQQQTSQEQHLRVSRRMRRSSTSQPAVPYGSADAAITPAQILGGAAVGLAHSGGIPDRPPLQHPVGGRISAFPIATSLTSDYQSSHGIRRSKTLSMGSGLRQRMHQQRHIEGYGPAGASSSASLLLPPMDEASPAPSPRIGFGTSSRDTSPEAFTPSGPSGVTLTDHDRHHLTTMRLPDPVHESVSGETQHDQSASGEYSEESSPDVVPAALSPQREHAASPEIVVHPPDLTTPPSLHSQQVQFHQSQLHASSQSPSDHARLTSVVTQVKRRHQSINWRMLQSLAETGDLDTTVYGKARRNSSASLDNTGALSDHLGPAAAAKADAEREINKLFLDRDTFSQPGFRFTFFSPTVGTVRARDLASLRTESLSLRDMIAVSLGDETSAAQRGKCYWLDVAAPTELEMTAIQRIFRIHPLTVEDILSEEARDKTESMLQDYMFVCYRGLDADPVSLSYMEPRNFYSIVMNGSLDTFPGDNASTTASASASTSASASAASEGTLVCGGGILTFHADPNSPHVFNALQRIRHLLSFVSITPEWINYTIIDDITDSFMPILRAIELEVDVIDDLSLLLSEAEQQDMLLRISNTRRRIVALVRILAGKADVVRGVMKRREPLPVSVRSASGGGGGGGGSSERIRRDNHPADYGMGTGARLSAMYSEIDDDGAAMAYDEPRPQSRSRGNTLSGRSDDAVAVSSPTTLSVSHIARLASTSPNRPYSVHQQHQQYQPCQQHQHPSSVSTRRGQRRQRQNDISLYYDDINDHVITMLSTARHLDLVLARAHSAYLAQISISMTHSANLTNDVVAKLTSIASVLVPLNIITGLMGMNVTVPWQTGSEENGQSTLYFWMIVAGMALWTVMSLILSRRFGIL